MEKRIKTLLKDPAYAQRMRIASLKELLDAADEAYYHTSEPLFDDKFYDTLRETYIKRAAPKDAKKRKTKVGAGAPSAGKQKARVMTIKLPVFMTSLDKIKNDPKALDRWIKLHPGPYHLRVKLDGISVLYWRDGEGEYHLASRHEGDEGGDMGTRLFPYLELPALRKGELVRGELIIQKAIFNERHRGEGRQSIRSCISGLIGSKDHFDECLAKDLHFVAYEFMPSPSESLPYTSQVEKLKRRKFPHLVESVSTVDLSMKILEDTFHLWRKNHAYEMDGVVFSNDEAHSRVTGRNPKYAKAFKMDCEDQMAETEVVAVHWNPSRFGILCPQIEVKPVKIASALYTFCSGKHAKFIQDSKIGPGTRIKLIRANDVIPDVYAVLEPTEASFPAVAYHWVSDVLIEEDVPSDERSIQLISYFWHHLGAQHFSDKSVRKLYGEGYTTIKEWTEMRSMDIEGLPGIKKKTAEKWVESVQVALGEATLDRILYASSSFGRGMGSRRMKWIFKALGDPLDFFTLGDGTFEELLLSIDGIGKEVASKVLEKRKDAKAFWDESFADDYKDVILENTREAFVPKEKVTGIDQVCKDMVILMTGFRDGDLKDFIEERGGTLAATFNKKVNRLLVKSSDTKNGKTDRARREGIPVQDVDYFYAEMKK